jgi:hypothetical protein
MKWSSLQKEWGNLLQNYYQLNWNASKVVSDKRYSLVSYHHRQWMKESKYYNIGNSSQYYMFYFVADEEAK